MFNLSKWVEMFHPVFKYACLTAAILSSITSFVLLYLTSEVEEDEDGRDCYNNSVL